MTIKLLKYFIDLIPEDTEVVVKSINSNNDFFYKSYDLFIEDMTINDLELLSHNMIDIQRSKNGIILTIWYRDVLD